MNNEIEFQQRKHEELKMQVEKKTKALDDAVARDDSDAIIKAASELGNYYKEMTMTNPAVPLTFFDMAQVERAQRLTRAQHEKLNAKNNLN